MVVGIPWRVILLHVAGHRIRHAVREVHAPVPNPMPANAAARIICSGDLVAWVLNRPNQVLATMRSACRAQMSLIRIGALVRRTEGWTFGTRTRGNTAAVNDSIAWLRMSSPLEPPPAAAWFSYSPDRGCRASA